MKITHTSIASISCWVSVILMFYASFGKSAEEHHYYSELNTLSYQYFKKGQYSKAYEVALLAKADSISRKSDKDLARSLSNIASVNLVLGNTAKALEMYSESFEISKRIDDLIGLESTINNFSGVFSRLGNYQEALSYLYLLPTLNNKERPSYQKAVAYNALIPLLLQNAQLEQAKYYLKLGTDLFQSYEDTFSECYFLLNKVIFHRYEGNSKRALKVIEDAKSLALENNYKGLYVTALKNEIEIYFESGNDEKVEKLVNKAIQLAQKLNFRTQLSQLLELQKNIFLKQKKYKEVVSLLEKINALEKDISGERVKQFANITRIDREVEKTQIELIKSQKDQKILVLELAQQHQNQIFWIVALLGTFATLFLFYSRIISKKEIARQKQVNKKLKELDRVKDRILKNTSHELRTPLNGIIGLSEVITEEYKNKIDEDVLEMVGLIKSSGEQLALVVNDILEMSKSRSNEITIINSEFDLIALIGDVIKICSPLAKEKNLKLKFQHSNKVESVFLDKTRLQQILFNTIGNAVKFTKQGSVDVSYILEEYGVKLVILDTGIGIPEDKIERILEGFEQVDSSDTRINSGSGLGLAISRNICQAIGGNIEISSTMNIGTQVTITLPFSG